MKLTLLFSSSLLVLISTAIGAGAASFYVTAQGSDDNSGSKDHPFASLERAQIAVREIIAPGLGEDVVVWIDDGVYRLKKPLYFNPCDSGTDSFKVIYAALPGTKPIISGGHAITGWKQSGDLWTVTLPEVAAGNWWFRQLYRDGQRLARGRYPAEGFIKIKSVAKDHMSLTFNEVLPNIDFSTTDTEVVVAQNWSITREIIKSAVENKLVAATQLGWVGHGHCLPRPGMNAFLEHHPDFVTQPGQWNLDRNTGELVYMGAPGDNPNRHTFTAPALEQLVVVNGTSANPVKNLHFKGLTFSHTAFNLPAIGYNGIQACYYSTTTKDETCFAVDVALELNYAVNCSIEDCQLEQLGASGIGLGAGCCNNQIVGCKIFNTGASGINIGHMKIKDPLWTDWAHTSEIPKNNTVANCRIHHSGEELWGAHGIFDGMTQGTRIVHNDVSWQPYGGIASGYVWNRERTSQQNCTIAHNHVYEVMLKLNDSGCIYTLGFQPGSVIEGNLLHGVRFGGFAGGQVCNNGIFFDDSSSGFVIKDNVIYDVDQAKGARNTVVRFNNCKEEWQVWINNTLQVEAEPPAEAAKLAETAGLEPEYRHLLD